MTDGETGADQGQDWRADFTDPDLKTNASLARYKTAEDFAKAYVNMEKFAGGAFRLPKPDAPDTEWETSFLSRVRPESPDAYELKLPEGQAMDETLVSAFRAAAHKSGLLPRQAKVVFEQVSATIAERNAAFVKQQEEGYADLLAKWGNDKEANLAAAERAISAVAGGPVVDLLKSMGIERHPALVGMFAAIGNAMEEDRQPEGASGAPATASRDAILARIREMRDGKHPYSNPRAGYREHEEAVEEMDGLMKQLAALGM